MQCLANLSSRFRNKREAEAGVVSISLECSKAAGQACPQKPIPNMMTC